MDVKAQLCPTSPWNKLVGFNEANTCPNKFSPHYECPSLPELNLHHLSSCLSDGKTMAQHQRPPSFQGIDLSVMSSPQQIQDSSKELLHNHGLSSNLDPCQGQNCGQAKDPVHNLSTGCVHSPGPSPGPGYGQDLDPALGQSLGQSPSPGPGYGQDLDPAQGQSPGPDHDYVHMCECMHGKSRERLISHLSSNERYKLFIELYKSHGRMAAIGLAPVALRIKKVS